MFFLFFLQQIVGKHKSRRYDLSVILFHKKYTIKNNFKKNKKEIIFFKLSPWLSRMERGGGEGRVKRAGRKSPDFEAEFGFVQRVCVCTRVGVCGGDCWINVC